MRISRQSCISMRPSRLPGALFAAATLASPAGFAAEPPAGRAEAAPLVREAQSLPECTCRAYGVLHAIGTEICLRTPQGLGRFRCGMDLNVTSWKKLDAPCPES